MAKLLKALAVLSAVVAMGAAHAVPVPGLGTWESTLQARDLDRDGVTDAFYDTVLNITWLRNANVNGFQDWETAKLWAGSLTVGGFGGWRLPGMVDTGPLGCDFSYGGTDCGWNVQTKSGNLSQYEEGQTVYSEFAHLFHVTLGNLSHYDTSGVQQDYPHARNTGGFLDMMPSAYWYGTEAGGFEATVAMSFDPVFGLQNGMFKFDSGYATAVANGDLCKPFPGGGNTGGCFPGPGPFPAPEPASLALVGAALAGLAATRRRRLPAPTA